LFTLLYGQSKRDHVWLFGYDSESNEVNSVFGGSVMDFNSTPPLIELDLRGMSFDATVASICDEAGNLLLYTNGVYIANAQGDTVANSTGLVTVMESLGFIDGMRLVQGALLLPLPDSDHEFVLIHEAIKIIPANPPVTTSISLGCNPVYETRIDLSLNNNEGAVTIKRDTLLDITMDGGKLSAVRHANGRDWWIVIPQHNSGLMYRFLLNPEGLQAYPPQDVGITLWHGLGQSVFSPDGSKYAHMSLHVQTQNYLNIFDFDRCTGLFSNPLQIFYTDNEVAGGVAISPNSRYLYLSSYLEIYQFDLYAEDIEASRQTVAVYDGYLETVPGFSLGFATRFFLAQLAPDNKIYLSTYSSVRSLHVINNPDLPGMACEVIQHGIMLPTLNAFGLPNYPHFRLGSLSGSSCDTLGPVAAFEYEALDFEFDFEDASLKNPTAWHWDFGDGNTSTEQNPQHAYLAEGTYLVCLEVSNAYGRDTFCQEIMIVIDDITEANHEGIKAHLYPNPATTAATLSLTTPASFDQGPITFHLLDAHGREMSHARIDLSNGHAFESLDLSALPAGMYICILKKDERVLWRKKLAKE